MKTCRNYERQDFTCLLMELNNDNENIVNTAIKPELLEDKNESATHEILSCPDKSNIHGLALYEIYSLISEGYDPRANYIDSLDLLLDVFTCTKEKAYANTAYVRGRMGCSYGSDQRQVENWLRDLRDSLIYNEPEMFEAVSNKLLTESMFCTYASNYLNNKIPYEEVDDFEKAEKNLLYCPECKNLHKLVSDEKVKFIVDRSSNTIHDKSCVRTRLIKETDLVPISEYEERNQCKYCCRRAYIRTGAKDFNEIKKYEKLFELMDLDTSVLKSIYIDYRMKTSMSHMNIKESKFSSLFDNAITVWYKEDTWRIGITNRGRVRLEHNNYQPLKNGERKFTKGFHVQSNYTYSTSIDFALKNIVEYSYKQHKAARKPTIVVNNISAEQTMLADSWMSNSNVIEIKPQTNPENFSSNSSITQNIEERNSFTSRPSKLSSFFKNFLRSKKTKRAPVDKNLTPVLVNLKTSPPANGELCLYQWKDEFGNIKWSAGLYYSKKLGGCFKAQYANNAYTVRFKDVICWTYMDEIQL